MTVIILIAVIVILAIWIVSLYNSLVKLRNNRENAFADIDVQLKQRHDLIPQLVETVKGYASHEKETLERVINARNGAISAKTIDDKIMAENVLTSALAGLKITLEAYPDLKANQNFLQWQEEISDLENKLAAVRRYFNSATKELNNAVETFPSNLIAGMFGFKKEVMFDLGEQRATLEEAPKSSSKDAIRRYTNPTEQEQFPVPAPALLVSLPGNGIAFAFCYLLHLLAMNDDGLTGAELLGYSTGMFIHLAPYVLGGVLIWFIIAYFANTSIINSATGSEPLSRMENKRVYNLVENLCMSQGMKMPKINIINDDSLNALQAASTKGLTPSASHGGSSTS